MVRRSVIAGGATGGGRNKNINLFLTDYRKFQGVLVAEMTRILQRAGEIVLDHTLQHVPRDTGALRASGRVRVKSTGRARRAAEVSFGGAENPVSPTVNAPGGIVDYAVFVHEDMPSNQDRTYRQGGPKFLDIGGQEAAPEVNAYIIGELKKIKV